MKRILSAITAIVYLVAFVTTVIPVMAEDILSETTILEAEFGTNGSLLIGGTYGTSGSVSEKGLTLLGGEKYWNESHGMYLWRTRIAYANAAFTVDEAKESLIETDERQQVYIKVTYSGISEGWFFVRYTNRNGNIVETERIGVSQADAADCGEYIFKCEDFDWNSDTAAPDFTICTTNYTEDKLYHQNASPNYSTKAVYIKNVQLYSDGTFNPFEIKVLSQNTGNIFFDNELAEFDISIKNVTASKNLNDIGITYKIYSFDRKMDKGSAVKSTRTVADLAAGSEYSQTIAAEVDKFGLYSLEVVLEHPLLGEPLKKDVLFSKCLSNNEVNPNMGANVHLIEGGDADKELSLMAKAGMGLVRDSFRWYYYEKDARGSYVLPEIWKNVLRKTDEYGLSMLPILAGNSKFYADENALAHHNDSFPITADALIGFKNYVKSFLSEPLVQNACEMVEIWNEPEIINFLGDTEIERDPATDKPTAAEYARLGTAYAEVLKAAYQGATEAEAELLGKDYQIGGFCFTQGVNYTGLNKDSALFTDYALNGVKDGKYFDYVTKHSYSGGTDPEIGHYGGKIKSYAPIYDVKFGINWIRGFMNGTKTAYDYTTCKPGDTAGDIGKKSSWSLSGGTKWNPQWITPTVDFEGSTGNKNYDFNYQKGIWHTETGWSTAINTDSRCTNDDEWQQGLNLVRIYNVIQGNNLPGNYQWSASGESAPQPIERDKVWFYEFIDSGTIKSEVEQQWGMLKADNSENPYAAKYSYLMIAAMNNIIGTDGEIVDYKEQISETTNSGSNFNHIAEYSNEETGRRTFMLWTTNNYAQNTSNEAFKENTAVSTVTKVRAGLSSYSNIKYFDILGNPIAESDVVDEGGRYSLTETPFYAVVDTKSQSESEYTGDAKIYILKDGIGVNGGSLDSVSGDYIASFGKDDIGKIYTVFGTLYKDGKLFDIKADTKTVLKSGTVMGVLPLAVTEDCDEVKLMLWDEKLKPFSKFVKINLKPSI